jgi:TM2 domain-containing membrane protein YozV
MSKRTSSPNAQTAQAVLAAVLAWLIPGAGHFYLGRRARGLVIFLTIGLTFWSGIAIGGVMTVDYHYERWWFLAQVFTGTHGLAGWYRQHLVYEEVIDELGPNLRLGPAPGGQTSEDQARVDAYLAEKGLAVSNPSDTIARAYSGVAGLLNLMCIFDVLTLGLLGIRGEPSTLKEPQPGREGDG